MRLSMTDATFKEFRNRAALQADDDSCWLDPE
jgi:hypothetical protein